MKKLFTLLLGGALTVGAAAVALPAALSNTATVQAADDDTPAYIENPPYDSRKATWNHADRTIDLEFTTPSRKYTMDDNYNKTYFDLEKVDKVELYTVVNYKDGELLQTWENAEPGKALTYSYKLDTPKKGETYYFRVYYYVGNAQTNSYDGQMYCNAGSFPGEVTDLTVSVEKGQCPVVIKFKTPATYQYSDVAIAGDIQKVELYSEEGSYWNPTRVTKQVLENVPAGSEQQFVLNDLAEDIYQWSIVCTAGDGEGQARGVKFTVGSDKPKTPEGVKAELQADGSVLLTWDAVTEGVNNGYIDLDALTYTVSMATTPDHYSNDFSTVAEGVKENSYTWKGTLEKPTPLTFNVKAVVGSQESYTANSNSLIAGPASALPFIENFDATPSSGYGVAAENLWVDGSTSYSYSWSFTKSCYTGSVSFDDLTGQGGLACVKYYWSDQNQETPLTSSDIDVEGKTELELTFSYYGLAPNSEGPITSSAKASVAFDGGEFTAVATGNMLEVTENGWITVTEKITVPAGAKTMKLQMAALSGNGNAAPVGIDGIKVRDADADPEIYPASASDLEAKYDADNEMVVVTFTAPSKTHANLGDVLDQTLPFITRIDLLRHIGYGTEYELVHSYDQPEPGATLKYEDTELSVMGNYYYKVVCYVGTNCDYGQFMNDPVLVGQIPEAANNLKGTSNRGESPVTITFTAPAKDTQGADLRELKSVKISRREGYYGNGQLLATLTDVKPGQECEYVDNSAEKGARYTYIVVASGSAGESTQTMVTVLVDLDTPNRPDNIVAAVNADGTVTLTWDAPEEGLNGGYVDTEAMTYTVLRDAGDAYSDSYADVLAEGVEGTTYTDVTVFDKQQSVKYFVKASLGNNQSYSQGSNAVAVGPAPALPYTENFNNKLSEYQTVAENIWFMENTAGSTDWSVTSKGNVGSEAVMPVGEDGGMAWVYFGSGGVEMDCYLTSAEISLENAELPVARFWRYATPGYEVDLAFQVSLDGGEFEEKWRISFMDDATAAGWQMVEVPLFLDEPAGTMLVRFVAHKGYNACPVMVDNLTIFDVKAPTLVQENRSLVWTVEDNEYAELTGFNLYINGKRHNEDMLPVETKSHDIAEAGKYTVTALYMDGALETNPSNEVEVEFQGIAAAGAGAVSVKAEAGVIAVAGAVGLNVTVSTVDGRVVYSAEGDARIAVVPGVYLVKVDTATAVKLAVK